MKNFALVFVFVLISSGIVHAAGLNHKEQPAPSTLVITGVTIVDVEKSVLRKNCTLAVSGEKIQKISNQLNTDVPDGIRIIDGNGLFLIPGLIDAHVHYYDQATFGPMMIVNGVLFVRDMGNQTHEALALREKLNNREILGPEMIVTGSVLDGNPPAIPQISIPCKTPEEGREAVRKQVGAGVDQIKVYSGLQKDVFLAIADEAYKLGIKPVGHIPESIYIEDAAKAGLKSAEHLFGIGKIIAKLLGDSMNLTTKGMGTDVPYFLRLNDVKREEFREVLKRISHTGMHVCPTLVVFKHGAHYKEIFSGKYPMLEYTSPMMKGMWKSIWGNQPVDIIVPKLLSPMQEVVKELHMCGIPLMIGTDLLCPGVIAGYSVHEEMALWQDAGISPAEILRSATVIPAKFMAVDNRLGTAAEGKTASFVLLRSNPLEDIRNTDQIESIVFRGRYFSRPDLDSLQQDVKKMCTQ